MWTPRRIVLLLIGNVLFIASYLGYGRSHLGAIDGLPALPDEFRKSDNGPVERQLKPRTSRVEQKLRQAFGEDCQQLKHPIKMELHSRNMVLAAESAKFDDDGRVFLEPISVAVFGKDQNDGKGVEINTIKGDRAWLTFDRPVFSPQDMNGRKIIGAELVGNIDIINNRRTEQRTDDLVLHINHGPLFYKESTHLIWTDDHIKILDQQSTPKPMQINGKGMEVELIAEPPAKPGVPTRKTKTENISGVKRMIIPANVEMYLYADAGRSGLPGGDREPAKATGTAAKAVGPKKPADDDKAQIVIQTPGRFVYDFDKDHDLATFDVPPLDPQHPPKSPQFVTVDRHLPKLNKDDRLTCRHLELRLHRKQAAPAGPAKPGQPKQPAPDSRGPDQGFDVETATATGGHNEVVIISDPDLRAVGDEFVHDSRKALTTLRGNPTMEAEQNGSIIRAPELQIQEQRCPDSASGPDGTAKTYQQVTATGPGIIDLWDEKKKQVTDHASWTTSMTSTRDFDTKGWCRDGPLDLMVLTGSARFWNDEQPSSLQGDTLKLWIMPREPEENAAAKSQPAEQAGPRPRRVDAIGHVASTSRTLIIYDTSRLKVLFRDALPGALPAPAPPTDRAAPAGPVATRVTTAPVHESAKQAPSAAPLSAGPPAPLPAGPAPMTGSATPAPADLRPAAPSKAEEPPRPMYLSASSVEAVVLRGMPAAPGENPHPGTGKPGGDIKDAAETKDVLEHLRCKGRVHVRQAGDPAKPEDKGTDIKGSTLELEYRPEGDLLVVDADDTSSQPNEEDLAQMYVNNLYIIGPKIAVDQRDNTVAVEGAGAMMMESATTVSGTVKKEPVPLTIHWTKSMLFTGKSAMFQGEIQAEQDNARMACEALTVFFDRPISLKEGNKTDKGNKDEKPPHVETMVCDRKVLIEEATPETDARTGKPVIDPKTGQQRRGGYRKISAPTVTTEANGKASADEKDTNKMRASGPGRLWLFQRGAADPLAASPEPARPRPEPKPAKKPDEDDVMKLTYVEYGKSMLANNQTDKANFWGGVRVLNMPGDDPTIEPNLDEMLVELPKGAMYLAAEQLEVLGQKGPDGKSYQQMTATRRVWVKGNTYEASCETLHFDESKDQIIFRGSENGLATLNRTLVKGGPADVIKGKEIIYIRGTGEIKVDGSPYLGNSGR